MAETRMPRGMLRGCQIRAANLESKSIGTIFLIAGIRVFAMLLCIPYILTADIFRRKEWWEQLHQKALMERAETIRQARRRRSACCEHRSWIMQASRLGFLRDS